MSKKLGTGKEGFTRNSGGSTFEHGGKSGGVGPHRPCQVVPARDEVNLVPTDAGRFDSFTGQPKDGE